MATRDEAEREEQMRKRLGSSAPDLTESEIEDAERGSGEQPGKPTFDPYGPGDFHDTKDNWGQSDKTGWGNQGNWGNEGYYQGDESPNEYRTQESGVMPDVTEKFHETTKQRDQG